MHAGMWGTGEWRGNKEQYGKTSEELARKDRWCNNRRAVIFACVFTIRKINGLEFGPFQRMADEKHPRLCDGGEGGEKSGSRFAKNPEN